MLLIERDADPHKDAGLSLGTERRNWSGVDQVQQIGTYSKVDRDHRGRTITVAYLAVVDSLLEVEGQDDAAKAQWFPIAELLELAFDHDEIMKDAFHN